jgi:ABC-type antimicrobial peptide transport system permease subunit
VFTLDDAVSDALARPRLITVVLGAFGGLGLLLGVIGLYGVLAFLVSQRQREIGVRLAMGARPMDVRRMVVKRGMSLTAAGIVVGIGGALALGHYMRTVLYGVQPTDTLTFVIVTATLLGAAAVASWVPARRAASVDPAITLRAD